MKIAKYMILLFCPFMVFAQKSDTKKTAQLGINTVQQVIAEMTLEEKTQLVVGATELKRPSSEEDATTIGFTENRVPGAAGIMAAIPRLGIPALILSDGPAGVRINPTRKEDKQTYYATAFPVATSLASSWDIDLVENVGRALGNEVKEYGIDVLLAPGMNIHRNPLAGRNFEYYSEDPLVSGKMAAAIVKGIQSNGVGASIKHFVANNQEGNRNGVDVIMSERAFRELYLRGFRLAIKESNPWTVMSSYNKINGVFTAESRGLLTDILREEWGYKGFVMTDWGGGRDRPGTIKAGNDLIMPGRPGQSDLIAQGVRSGQLKMEDLDKSVERILDVILKSPTFQNYTYSNKPDLKAHAQLVRKAGADGIVLLKNSKKTLPLADRITNIAVFGNASFKTIAGGTGSGDVHKAYMVSVIKGLETAGYTVNSGLKKDYLDYFLEDATQQRAAGAKWPKDPKEMVLNDSLVKVKSVESDIALITIGRNSGEVNDRDLKSNYHLTPDEIKNIKLIAAAFHQQQKEVVIVLNIAGVIDMTEWQDSADALLLAWQPGQEAGNSIADVLSGKVNPSGKLATTFPLHYSDVPSAANFPGLPVEKPLNVRYEEGIYVGYRYHETFNVPVAYEFGFGMSYTDFNVSRFKVKKPNDSLLRISCTLKNTGPVPGRQVVQVYIGAPNENLDKPGKELKAFKKSKMLMSGEQEKMVFDIKVEDLASFYENRSAWVCDKGKYRVELGFSSKNIKARKSFNLKDARLVETTNRVLLPKMSIQDFKAADSSHKTFKSPKSGFANTKDAVFY